MPSPELETLAELGLLNREPLLQDEFEGLIEKATVKLEDSRNEDLALASRFDLAYGACHAIARAALRWHGYRPRKRYVVFQALPHTLGTPPETWRVLAKCHEQRNRMEYEGPQEVDERLLRDAIEAGDLLLRAVRRLPGFESL